MCFAWEQASCKWACNPSNQQKVPILSKGPLFKLCHQPVNSSRTTGLLLIYLLVVTRQMSSKHVSKNRSHILFQAPSFQTHNLAARQKHHLLLSRNSK